MCGSMIGSSTMAMRRIGKPHKTSLLRQPPVVGEHGVLGNDDDAVADHALGRLGTLLKLPVVGDPHVAADAAVLVDNRSLDVRVVADAQGRLAAGGIAGAILRTLIVVVAQQHAVADGDVAADAAA